MYVDLLGSFCTCSGVNSFIKNGFDKNGNQRYICKYCRKLKSNRTLKPLPSDFAYKPYNELTNAELYCLGFILADGTIYKNRIQIQVQKYDESILHIIQNTFNTFGKITHSIYSDGRETKSISFRGAYFQDDLYHLGLFPNKTTKELWLPFMNSFHFLRGFLDGDGCIYYAKKEKFLKVSWCGSVSILTGLMEFMFNSIGVKKKKLYNHGAIKLIRYASKESLKICEALYKDSKGIRLERKYKKYKLMYRYHKYKAYILNKYPQSRNNKGQYVCREN